MSSCDKEHANVVEVKLFRALNALEGDPCQAVIIDAIRHLDAWWRGSGKPDSLALATRIARLSAHL